MPVGIKVTPEQLQEVSGQLRHGASTIDSTLHTLENRVAPLGSDWAGVAQSRFLELWAQWQRGARDVHHALTGIAQLMQQAGVHYDTTETNIARSFGRA